MPSAAASSRRWVGSRSFTSSSGPRNPAGCGVWVICCRRTQPVNTRWSLWSRTPGRSSRTCRAGVGIAGAVEAVDGPEVWHGLVGSDVGARGAVGGRRGVGGGRVLGVGARQGVPGPRPLPGGRRVRTRGGNGPGGTAAGAPRRGDVGPSSGIRVSAGQCRSRGWRRRCPCSSGRGCSCSTRTRPGEGLPPVPGALSLEAGQKPWRLDWPPSRSHGHHHRTSWRSITP